jgi:hypothetical protein
MAQDLTQKIETNSESLVAYKSINNKISYEFLSRTENNYSKKQDLTQTSNTKLNIDNQKTKTTSKSSSNLDIIDVIKDYDWTYSAKSLSKNSDVPYVHIKEFKILGNSYMSSLMTSSLLFPDIAKSATDASSPASNFFQKIQDTFKDNKFGKFMSSVGNSTSDIVNKLETTTKKASNWVKTQMEAIDKTANAWGGSKQDLIDNYSYLYLRKPTNTEYKFPYFENEFFNITNSFEDSYEGGNKLADALFGTTMDIMKEAETIASSVVALSEPGMFIQRPKFYNFGGGGYEIRVNFYLFNTLNPNSYLKNVELITKLIIQNTPHRHNRLLVDPVCIYELTVPGRGFYPYTFISNLNVSHVGTKRSLEGPNGNRIIVPDAFKVEIVFKSLTSEVNNFIIPETGTSGIDVTQKYGLGKIIKDFPIDSNNKTTEQSQNKPETPNIPTINPPTNISKNTPTNVRSASAPVRIALGF